MTTTADRKTDQLGTPGEVIPAIFSFGVAASTKIYAGAMVAINASGYAVPASADNTLTVWGRCEKAVDNTSGSNGDLQVSVRVGVFFYASGTSGDAITKANVGSPCYVIDDHTVGLTDGSGARPKAGTIVAISPSGQVGVLMGPF